MNTFLGKLVLVYLAGILSKETSYRFYEKGAGLQPGPVVIPTVVELTVKNKVIYSVDNNGKVIKDKIDDEIDFDYDYYKGIKGKWYECDNYWVSEKFYEKNKEPYWFYDSCSPSEYEGEDKE